MVPRHRAIVADDLMANDYRPTPSARPVRSEKPLSV